MLHNFWMSDYSYSCSGDMAFFPPLSTKAGISSCFILVHPLGLFYLCSYLGSLWFWLFSATQEEIKKNPSSSFPGLANAKVPSTKSVSTLSFSSDSLSPPLMTLVSSSRVWEIPNVLTHIRVFVYSRCAISIPILSCYQSTGLPGS